MCSQDLPVEDGSRSDVQGSGCTGVAAGKLRSFRVVAYVWPISGSLKRPRKRRERRKNFFVGMKFKISIWGSTYRHPEFSCLYENRYEPWRLSDALTNMVAAIIVRDLGSYAPICLSL